MIPFKLVKLCGSRSYDGPAFTDSIYSDVPVLDTLIKMALVFTTKGEKCMVVSREHSIVSMARRVQALYTCSKASTPELTPEPYKSLRIYSIPSFGTEITGYCRHVIDLLDDTEKPTVLLLDGLSTSDYDVVNAFREYAINNYMTVIYAKQLPHDGREHINSPLWEITK